jgi:hypothetical protein
LGWVSPPHPFLSSTSPPIGDFKEKNGKHTSLSPSAIGFSFFKKYEKTVSRQADDFCLPWNNKSLCMAA